MTRRFGQWFTILSVMLALCSAQMLMAQTDKGAITGHVTDSSGSILQGASVELEPGNIFARTGAQGEYFVNNLPPGSYTLTVTYVGFAVFTKAVAITAGQTQTADAKMEVASTRDEVLVTAERPSGEAE
jgi:Carboxypeptidase regulatory-like domain